MKKSLKEIVTQFGQKFVPGRIIRINEMETGIEYEEWERESLNGTTSSPFVGSSRPEVRNDLRLTEGSDIVGYGVITLVQTSLSNGVQFFVRGTNSDLLSGSWVCLTLNGKDIGSDLGLVEDEEVDTDDIGFVVYTRSEVSGVEGCVSSFRIDEPTCCSPDCWVKGVGTLGESLTGRSLNQDGRLCFELGRTQGQGEGFRSGYEGRKTDTETKKEELIKLLGDHLSSVVNVTTDSDIGLEVSEIIKKVRSL